MAPRPEIMPSDVRHVAHFADSVAVTVGTAAGYLASGIIDGAAAVVIAKDAHRTLIAEHLAVSGIDVQAAVADGTLLLLDAEETLAKLLVDGRPDADAFDAVVAPIIWERADKQRPVVAYGEMVTVLWDAGAVTEAIELEELWNGLLGRVTFSLLCTYPAMHGEERARDVAALCAVHSDAFGHHAPVAARGQLHLVQPEGKQTFPPTLQAPRDVRVFVEDALIRRGYPAPSLGPVSVAIAELASNVVRHARTPFDVSLTFSPERVRIAFRDGDPTLPTLHRQPPTVDWGRGIAIVEALTAAWGAYAIPDGKVVWTDIVKGGAR